MAEPAICPTCGWQPTKKRDSSMLDQIAAHRVNEDH